MAVTYEKIVAEDLEIGSGAISRTNPQGGTMNGSKINPFTFITPLTQTEITALTTGTDPFLVYNSTTQKLNFYNGTAWTEICDGVL